VLAQAIPEGLFRLAGKQGLWLPTPAYASTGGIRLDTNDPLANFTKEGGQALTPSPFALNFNDTAETDSVQLFGSDIGAAKGNDLDLLVSFKVGAFLRDGADTGVRFIINDGQDRSALCACTINAAGEKGVALARGTNFALPENYSAVVPVDWTAPTSMRIRRAANGDAEILEVNGVAPATRALLPAAECVGFVRAGTTVEFGTFGIKPIASLDVFSLESVVPQPAAVPVAIDIKPGSYPNSINPKSKGVIPVAILTTSDFDAATVDPDTVLFGPAEAEPVHWALEDVDGDGDTDMVLHFKTQETGIAPGDTSATLTGQTYDGTPIKGTDSVNVVP